MGNNSLKYLLPLFITLFLLLSTVQSYSISTLAEETSLNSLLMTQSEQNSNVYYTVGMGYADIWTNSAGEYIIDPVSGLIVAPGQTIVSHQSWSYKFKFSDRKVKAIAVFSYPKTSIISGETQEWTDKMFSTARYGDSYDDWKRQMASVIEIYNKGITGIGTDTAIQTVSVKAILDATEPKIVIPGPPYADGVTYQRQYFPFLFRIELEPLGGTAYVKYFTTTGASLNGVDGFSNYEKPLIKGKDYSFPPAPDTAKYTYSGWKKSTNGSPSGGEMMTGTPWPLNPYEGGYDYYVNLYYEPVAPDTGHDTKPPNCTAPTQASVKSGEVLNPAASAVIKADTRGAERFNVLDGIPTSESLYGNVFGSSYLYQDKFVQMTGKCTIEVTVTRDYELSWDPGKEVTDKDGKKHTEPDPQHETEQLSLTYQIERPYSYWIIDQLQVFRIKQAVLQNYAFDGGGITITPSGYSPPAYSFNQSGGITAPDNPGTITAPSTSKTGGKEKPNLSGENLKSYAETAIGRVRVHNDSFTFNGLVIMDSSVQEQSTSAPGQIASPQPISANVLYSPGHFIPSSKTNEQAAPSSGTLEYQLMDASIGGGEDQRYAIAGINSVTVHTPVVMYPSISDDKEHNQRTKPDLARAALILDRPFTVTLPTSGQHNNYLGYGSRDYAKYTAYKQVKFAFDVYTADKSSYIQAGTWINVPVNQLMASFYMPVWVDEGAYTVYFRSIAENAQNGYTAGEQANRNWQDHAAVSSLNVDVIGRLYDFRITDILDYNWEKAFRTTLLGQKLATRAAYWVGYNGIDGEPRGNRAPYKLPIYPGSHPDSTLGNVAVKTGYTFRFDLKTKGNLFAAGDEIEITPSFDYTSEDGSERYPVDLYYHSQGQKFIKIGSAEDQVQRTVMLNDPSRGIPEVELIDTAVYRYDHDYTFNEITGLSREGFASRFVRVLTKQQIPVGTYHGLWLGRDVRTLVGPKSGLPASVNPQRALAAEQKWYGEYSLPAEVYIVKRGTNLQEYGRTHGGLTDHSELFLRNGFIIVNFDLESLPGGDSSKPKLQYIHAPLMNQWRLEGYEGTAVDKAGHIFKLKDGDVLFYEAGLSSRDDFRPMVTH